MRKYFILWSALAVVACGAPQRTSSGQSTADDPGEAGAATSGKRASARARDGASGETSGETNDAGAFALNKSDKSKRPKHPSKIKATATQSAVRFFVIDKQKGPVEGIVISLTSPTGEKYYTEETDEVGYAEVLVPKGQTYDLVYLSLGRRNVSAKVKVSDKPNLNLKLTLRYFKEEYQKDAVAMREPDAEPAAADPDDAEADEPEPEPEPRFVLTGVEFDSGKAKLKSSSFARLDTVVEYMQHKKSARIEISGHTDNVGKQRVNKRLSQKRADACRDYLVSKGIDGSRIEAIGHGDSKPIASNDTTEGRQKNRRIEATEL